MTTPSLPPPSEKTAHWFRALSESEPVETYLKFAASDLARTCESVEGHQIDTDDTLFIQSLQSIADYVKAAQVCRVIAMVTSSQNRNLMLLYVLPLRESNGCIPSGLSY